MAEPDLASLFLALVLRDQVVDDGLLLRKTGTPMYTGTTGTKRGRGGGGGSRIVALNTTFLKAESVLFINAGKREFDGTDNQVTSRLASKSWYRLHGACEVLQSA